MPRVIINNIYYVNESGSRTISLYNSYSTNNILRNIVSNNTIVFMTLCAIKIINNDKMHLISLE